jgi:tetratricopeptide (TPR) repeat protein
VQSGTAYLLGEENEVVPFIGSLFAITYPELEGISPEYWKDKVHESVQKLLSALVDIGPTIVCFEDLHWADPSFIELLHRLIKESSQNALFVCTYRSHFSLFDAEPPGDIGQRHREIRLRELAAPDTQEMLISLLETENPPKNLSEFVREKSEGNPFYLEEMINSLIESDILTQDNGNWKLNRSITEADIPATIQGVLTARVDRLEGYAKRVLQEASVIGRAFLYDILKRISEIDTPIEKYLSSLESFDLIRTQAMEPDLEYIFKHALTQEVVYNGLLKKERQEIHERIGLAIEQLFSDRLSEFHEILAHHFQKGRSKDKAVAYLMKAGEKSLNKFSLKEAHQYYKLSMDLLSAEGTFIKDRERILFSLFNSWAFVYYYSADLGALNRLLGKYRERVYDLDDQATIAMFLAWYGWSKWGCEKFEEAEIDLTEALKIAEEIKNKKIIAYVYTWLAWNYLSLGQLDKAIDSGKKALDLAQFFKTEHYIQFKPLAAIAQTYWYKGDRRKHLNTGRELVRIGEAMGILPAKIFGYLEIGGSYLLDGDVLKSIEWLEKISREGKDHIYSNVALMCVGMGYLMNGESEKAEKYLQAMLQYCGENDRWPWLVNQGLMLQAVAWVASGRMNAGMKKLLDIRAGFKKKKGRYIYTMSEYLLGSIYNQIALGEGEVNLSVIIRNIGFLIRNIPFAAKRAEDHFKEAIKLSDDIGTKAIKGQALLDLGRLYVGKKRIEEAKETFIRAIEVFELCEIETFKKQAQEALASLE